MEQAQRMFDCADSPSVLNNKYLTVYIDHMVVLDAVYVGAKEQDYVIQALYDELKDSGEVTLSP
jgi:hypothetical protein